MVIKSPFKDYYDFVAHKYGGGDPRLVYSRTRVSKSDYLAVEIENCTLYDPKRFAQSYGEPVCNKEYLYLVITGKAYLLSRPIMPREKWELSSYKLQVEHEEHIPHWRRQRFGVEFGKEYPFLVELCKKVQAPVFVITEISWLESTWLKNRPSRVIVLGQCPILSRLGIPALIDPYQMYQDISVFMGNKMKDTPDTKPPIELSNNQKIVKAGFDLVQSFRHRK